MDLVLVLAAVVPAVFLLIQVYRADRLEKEPLSLLLSLVICGVISTVLAALTEQVGDMLLSNLIVPGTRTYDVLLYFGVVAVSEEGFKYLLLKLRTWRSPHFDCSFDGVVYAVFLSLGFALWENVQYVMRLGLGTAIARAVTAIPGHACFGVFMGTWYGIAKRCDLAGEQGRSGFARFLAFLLPTLLHGLYDYIAVNQETGLGVAFLGFVALLYGVSMHLVKSLAKNDAYLVRQDLFLRDEDD